MTAILIGIASGLVSASVVWLMLRFSALVPVDTPNERSLHNAPVPRGGGLGVLAGFVVGVLNGSPEAVLVGAVVALALLSWVDDRHNLPAKFRLVVHFAAALALFAADLLPRWGDLTGLVLVLGVVWLTNLYNFMDGSDGLAGGMAVFGFGTYGLAALMGGSQAMAALCLSLAGAAAGFLVFNFHPARIFMGDVGSIPLGFLAAALGLDGLRQGLWSLPFMLMAFSPFIMDATLTLLKRARRGERVWQAHREHYYQRLVQMGWGHEWVALAAYALMGVASLCAMLTLYMPDEAALALLVALGAGLLGLARWVDQQWRDFLRVRNP